MSFITSWLKPSRKQRVRDQKQSKPRVGESSSSILSSPSTVTLRPSADAVAAAVLATTKATIVAWDPQSEPKSQRQGLYWPPSSAPSQFKSPRYNPSLGSAMNATFLPTEIILHILDYAVPQFTCRQALNLRQLCKAFDQEMLTRLYGEGVIDSYATRFVDPDCFTCRGSVRPEKSHLAISRKTLMRYLVGLIGWRTLENWDMRLKIWRVLRRVKGENAVREAVMEAWQRKGKTDKILTNEAKQALSFGLFDEKPHLEARVLADVIAALLGIRNAWKTLGPHHEVCGSRAQRLKNKNFQFWCFLVAVYLNDEELAEKYLEQLRPAREQDNRHNEVHFEGFKRIYGEFTKQCIWAETLAAGLTVAIRRGRKKMFHYIVNQYWGQTQVVLESITFFNEHNVLDTAFITTSDNTVTPQARQLAVEVSEWLLIILDSRLKQNAHRQCQHHRAAAEISLQAPKLFLNAFEKLFQYQYHDADKRRACQYVLCQAVLRGDVAGVEYILSYMSEQLPSPASNRPGYTYRSDFLPFWKWVCHLPTPLESWADERGVQADRLLNGGDPFRIAAAQGHSDIVKLLFEHLDLVRHYITGWHNANLSHGKDEINSMKAYRMRSQLPCHPLRTAVNDVFIDRSKLPNHMHRGQPNPEILTAFLDGCPEDLNWGGEVISCAGLSDNSVLLELLVKKVELSGLFPDDGGTLSGGVLKGKFIKGSAARTIGERALQHALRMGRVGNVEVLLRYGARLAEGTKLQQVVFVDEDGYVEEDELHRVLMDSGTVAVKSRLAYQKYFIPLPGAGMMDEARRIENDDKRFKWMGGNKARNTGMRTVLEELPLFEEPLNTNGL